MKILSLELILYKRLALNNIRHFKLDMVSSVQLILGTNGSGKSSILQELTPLPAAKENYRKGGKKTIVISHQEKSYTLISDFTNGQDHSFKVDSVELNDGGTVTIQRELVKTHFGITQDIHELMLGMEVFSNMSPARRREWFTRLCTADYSYAIALYKRVQEQLNITGGALKHAKKRLATEMVKSMDSGEAQQIRARISDLTRESQAMYMLREVETMQVDQVQTSALELNKQIEQMCSEFHSIRRVLKEASYITPQEHTTDLNDKTAEIASLQITYNELSEEFIALSGETEAGEEMNTHELLELREKISNTRNRAKDLLAQRAEPLEGLRARLARDAMEAIYQPLTDALAQLPANESGRFNPKRMSELQEQIRLHEVSLSINQEKLEKVRHDVRHMESLKNGDSLECPKCEHTWIAGYSEIAHKALEGKLFQGAEYVATLTKKVEELRSELQEQQSYNADYTQAIRMMRSCPELNPLWQEVMTQGLVAKSPQATVSYIDRVKNDIFLMCMSEDLNDVCLADARRLEHAEFAQSENFKAKKARMKALEERIGEMARAISYKQRQCEQISIVVRRVNTMYNLCDQIRAAGQEMHVLQKEGVRAIKNAVIDESLAQVHEELAMLSVRINSVNAHEQLVADINHQIDELSKNEIAYRLLQQSLSPVDGLIAEGMLGFIRQFVARMNIFIAKVWTYSMEVRDCSLEEDAAELNYKFPVHLAEIGETIPDVSRCSSGMVEMLNLAFRIAASQCFGIDNGPLILDEFGKTFDEAHREAATRVIAQLIEQMSYSQLYMVSHYESSWGAFYKAQVTVVDKRNITLPANTRFNEHTLIAA